MSGVVDLVGMEAGDLHAIQPRLRKLDADSKAGHPVLSLKPADNVVTVNSSDRWRARLAHDDPELSGIDV